MDYILLSIFCILTAMHLYLLRLCFYILATKILNILNTVHSILMFSTIVPTIIGDLLVILSVTTNGVADASFIVELMDFCSALLLHTLFIHLFQYRSTLLYKGIAPRFYDYIYHIIEYKAMMNLALCGLGFVISIALKYSITAFLVVYQMVLTLGNVIMYILMKRKFESLNIIQSQSSSVGNPTESAISVRTYRIDTSNNNIYHKSVKRTVKEIHEETRLYIYNNLKRALIAMAFFIIISVILLVIFQKKSPSNQYYLSISYRLVSIVPIVACSKPIIKTCAEKRKKAASSTHRMNPDDADDVNDD